jgi:predicted ABC-type ATPase
MSPRVLVIAGPNGAGKTSFAREFLPGEANLLNFINADLIAAGLSPNLARRRSQFVSRTRSKVVEAELAALRRAAKNALELAKRTGTACYVIKDGKIVDIARSKSSRGRKRGKS